jgi:type IV pilus assembly protein PilQ
MRIDLTISNDAPDPVRVDGQGNPFINKKKAKTNMIVNDGETIVIGGIISKKEGTLENRVPGLGDIPVLGWLFKTRNRTYQDTELLIFLTPRFVQAADIRRITPER